MKKLVTNYTFNAAAKTITFSDYVAITAEQVLLITNVTDGIIIYNFASTTLGGTVATNVLTLEYDTTLMSNTDDIQIFYDETQTPNNQYGQNDVVVSLTPTDILSYTVPAASTLRIQGIRVSGTATGLFRLKVNGTIVATTRTSAAERTVTVDFREGTIAATAGQAVVVTATHEETANQSLDANVFGLLIT